MNESQVQFSPTSYNKLTTKSGHELKKIEFSYKHDTAV